MVDQLPSPPSIILRRISNDDKSPDGLNTQILLNKTAASIRVRPQLEGGLI